MNEPEQKIISIPLNQLHQFPNHPFRVQDDDLMKQLIASIEQVGVLVPAIVHINENDEFVLISGHRRRHACEVLGISELPCIVLKADINHATSISMTITPKSAIMYFIFASLPRKWSQTVQSISQRWFSTKSSRKPLLRRWTLRECITTAMKSSPDSLRFTSEMGTVTYFDNWTKVVDWLDGTVFDDPDVEREIDHLIHPEHYETDKSVTALIVEPMREPHVKTISTDLSGLQKVVGGFIEIVYPFEDNVGLIVNEEGKLEGLPLNRGLYNDKGKLYDVIAGTFAVVGLEEDDFCSLTSDQLNKYSEMYKQPQIFVKIGNEIQAFPVEEEKPVGTFDLYQLKDSVKTDELRYMSYKFATRDGAEINSGNYSCVYTGKLYAGDNLEDIYERFNLQKPDDFNGHSLSVSDVIATHKDGQDTAWYVDSFGYKQLPDFFADNPLKKVEEQLEDDYGMIDGIINNGEKHYPQEEKKASVIERLQEKKKESRETEESKPKQLKNKAKENELS